MSLIIRLFGKKSDHDVFRSTSGINETLREIGISDYQFYPKHLPDDITLPWLNIWRSKINYLKNIYLEFKMNPNWTPDSDSLFFGEDRYFFFDLAEEIIGENKSHLVWHSNYCSYYVPVEFKNISISDDELKFFGSSINLCHELKDLANKLNLDLGNYTPDFELLYEQRIYELENDPLGFEKMLLLYLYNFCLASIKYDLIIEFSG